MDKARSERIAKAMKLAGFSRDSLAMATGYSAGTISKIKSGAEFKTDQLLAICSVLKVSPNYILGISGHEPSIEKIATLLKAINCEQTTSSIEIILSKIKKQ